MKNKILLIAATLLLTLTTSCTQGPGLGKGDLGTDVGNPLPDEADVLIPVKTFTGFCFVFELESEMEWEEISDEEVSISDGDLVVDLNFAEVVSLYSSEYVIGVPGAMELADKKALLAYTGPGFAYDASGDFPTAFLDEGSDREISHLNPTARTIASMKGDKSFIDSIAVSLDTSSARCRGETKTDDGEGRVIVPAFDTGDIKRPDDMIPVLPMDGGNTMQMEMTTEVPIGRPVPGKLPSKGTH